MGKLKLVKRIESMDIDKELKEKLIAEIRVISKTVKGFTDRGELILAFTWSDSPSGHKFWDDIDQKYFAEAK